MDKLSEDIYIQNLNTSLDYSESMYLVYIELGELSDSVRDIIINIIPSYCTIETELKFGYLCKIQMQTIPDIIRALSLENIAIYHVIIISKI